MRRAFLFTIGLAACAALWGWAVESRASLMLATSRAALGGNDYVDWSVLGPANTNLTNPFSVTSAGGVGMTASLPSAGGGMQRRNQGSGWLGNFAAGDALLWTKVQQGPLRIVFDDLVSGVGAQIQEDFFGAFTARIEAFNADNTSLGAFTRSGTSNTLGNNSAIFIGVKSGMADIKSVKFDIVNQVSFAINRMDLIKVESVAAISPVNTVPWPGTTAVPEPGSGLVCLMGVAGLMTGVRRRGGYGVERRFAIKEQRCRGEYFFLMFAVRAVGGLSSAHDFQV